MKKKQAKARKSKLRKPESTKAQPASAAAPPPEPYGDGADALSIEAMLRAQIVETHLAAMDCLRRARTAATPEVRHQALTHATRLLTLFTRQVKTLEQGRWPAPAARTVMGAHRRMANAVEQKPAEAAKQPPADDPPDLAAFALDADVDPARQNGTGGAAPSGP